MRAIDRYIFRQLFEAAVFATVAVTGAIWLTQSLRYVELIVTRGLSLGMFGYLTILLVPSLLTIILPLALFAGTMFTYHKLTMDSELVVLRAAGMSPMALARPLILLSALVAGLCYAINLYFMPAAFRQFKDFEFTIRNDYATLLLQEGTFNTLSDGLTVYVRERERNGELSGILVHDNRAPEKPITLMAERGMVVASSNGPRVVMINGNRQEVERADGRLSLLHFDRYSLDLSQFNSSVTGRWHEPTERFLGELFHPDPSSPGDLHYAPKLRAEGHQRLTSPLYAIAFSAIALAVLLSGEFNRRGQAARVILAVSMVVGVQSLGLGLHNLTADVPQLAALMYANALVPIALSAYALGRRPGRRRLPPLGRPFAPGR